MFCPSKPTPATSPSADTCPDSSARVLSSENVDPVPGGLSEGCPPEGGDGAGRGEEPSLPSLTCLGPSRGPDGRLGLKNEGLPEQPRATGWLLQTFRGKTLGAGGDSSSLAVPRRLLPLGIG